MTSPDVLAIDPSAPAAQVIERAVSALTDGALVVAPTETRYGVLALVSRRDALERLYALKNRNRRQPTAVFVRYPREIEELGVVNRAAKLLMNEFLPGPLTLVLPAKEDLAEPIVIDGLIGMRCSSAAVIEQLLKGIGSPLTATSANLSGRVENETIAEVQRDFGEGVDLYIDGGQLTGETSTVVKCVGSAVCVLRAGAIPTSEINRVVKTI